MLKEQLTSMVAGIVLQRVRSEKGRLTEISELSKINRREFTVRGLSKMRMHRLLRIFYALTLVMTYHQFKLMMDEIHDAVREFSDKYDYDLLDE